MEVDLRRRGLQSFNPAEFANSEEHLQLLLQVHSLDLSFNALYTIRGLEGLTHLAVLNLSNNGLRSLGGGLPLSLRELDVSHNSIGSLQNAALLPLQSLTSLNVSFNELEDLRGVPNVTAQLAYLDVRSNRLSSLQGIEHCSQLHTLHAEANLLREVADVVSLRALPCLSALFLSGNPLLLRKRLLHQVRLLLPLTVDQDDLPTTAPASSVRSSTAPPPSVPDTSSVCSLDHSAVNTTAVAADDDDRLSHRSSRPASLHQSGLPLSIANSYTSSSRAAEAQTRSPSGAAQVRQQHQSQPSVVRPRMSPSRSATSTVPARAVSPPHPHTMSSLVSTSTAVSGTPPGSGVVGGDSDSPTCPRRSLPSEHRLRDSASTVPASAASQLRSTDAIAGSSTLLTSPSLHNLSAGTAFRRGNHGPARLTREELEEQLVRVMAERDAYRREAVALRQQVDELLQQQQAAQEHMSTLMPSALSDRRSATMCSAPSPTTSRTMVSDVLSPIREAAPAQRVQPQPQQLSYGRPHMASRILAVEMSDHTSSANSECAEKREAAPLAARSVSQPSTRHTSADATATAMSSAVSHVASKPMKAKDRREIAALFMSKLQGRAVS